MNKKIENKQSIYNSIGILLIFGIMLGSGILLIKNDRANNVKPLEIIEPTTKQTVDTQVKGETVSGKININTAGTTELDTLAGIGPATAQKIIDYRTQNGLFKTIEDLMDVSGIGEAKLGKIRDKISI